MLINKNNLGNTKKNNMNSRKSLFNLSSVSRRSSNSSTEVASEKTETGGGINFFNSNLIKSFMSSGRKQQTTKTIPTPSTINQEPTNRSSLKARKSVVSVSITSDSILRLSAECSTDLADNVMPEYSDERLRRTLVGLLFIINFY